jgi:hypothetical protein
MGFTFNEVYRRARQTHLPLPARWSHLKRCVWKHARWIDHDFGGTLERLSVVCALNPAWLFQYPVDPHASAEHLDTLLTIVAEERVRLRVKFRHYQTARQQDKRQGRLWAPHQYLQQLHAPDYYHPACIPLAPWRREAKYGYLNRAGEFALRPLYDWAAPFVADTALVRIAEKRFIINT